MSLERRRDFAAGNSDLAAATSFAVKTSAAALALIVAGLSGAYGFGLKSDICGSWNNYCEGGTLPAPAQPSQPSQRSAPGGSSGYNPMTRGWYCRATARNGAWGWSKYSSEDAARSRALHECENNSRGLRCSIRYCRQEGPGTAPSGATSVEPSTGPMSAPLTRFRPAGAVCGGMRCLHDQTCGPDNRCYNPNLNFYCGHTRCVIGHRYAAGSACGACTTPAPAAAQGAPREPLPGLRLPFRPLSCGECYRKLKGAIRRGWATGKPRTYIATSIAGYENCKAQVKEPNSCSGGDLFARGLPSCANPGFNDAGSRKCVEHALISDPSQY